MPAPIRYAIGYSEPDGLTWLLARSPGFGNLIRTPDPLSARTWDSVPEAMTWLEDLPLAAKQQIKDRELSIFPVAASISAATHRFKLIVQPEPEGETSREHAKAS